VQLGRVDSSAADPAGRVPGPDASTEDVRRFMLTLGCPPSDGGFLAPKAPFWERQSFLVYPLTTADPRVRAKP